MKKRILSILLAACMVMTCAQAVSASEEMTEATEMLPEAAEEMIAVDETTAAEEIITIEEPAASEEIITVEEPAALEEIDTAEEIGFAEITDVPMEEEDELLPGGEENTETQKYTVALRKPEGGQLVFSESMILPEQEILDEQTADCRAFAKDEVILISAVPEEGYELAEIKVESLTAAEVSYPLEESEEGFLFYMPEDSVVISAIFVKEELSDLNNSGEDGEAAEAEAEEADVAEDLTQLDMVELGDITPWSLSSTSTRGTAVKVTGVRLDKTSAKLVQGESITLKPTISPSNATNKAVVWTSSNESVAKVNAYGKVTAVEKGTATIRVKTSDGGKSSTCKITVTKPVSGVTLDRTSAEMLSSKSLTLHATVSPSDATNKKVTWSSSDTSVVNVFSNGNLVSRKPGTATITVTTADGGKTASCKITVKRPVSGVRLDRGDVVMLSGESMTLHATVSPSDATNKAVTWSSSDPSVASVSSSGTVTANNAGTARIVVTTADGNKTYSCKITVKKPSVSYQTHVQSYGWQDWKADGDMSGTQNQSKRLEGIRIKISNDNDLGIRYVTHVQTYGWESSWKSNGAMSGTSGQSKRLEAIRIELTGRDASKYDVWYCVHAQNFGWLNWAKNGADAGTAGYAYRLEGIKIKILPKGSSAPAREGSSTAAFYSRSDGPAISMGARSAGVGYNTHVQTYGWQSYSYDGAMAGTQGQSKRLEGIHIALTNPPYSGGIEYRTHVQTYGWQGWVRNGAMSGTSGQSKRLEAIEIRLTGEMAKHYDVYYRVHAQHFGWMGWAKNGASAGTAGYSYRLEGIQIVLREKGQSAPAASFAGQSRSTAAAFAQRAPR